MYPASLHRLCLSCRVHRPCWVKHWHKICLCVTYHGLAIISAKVCLEYHWYVLYRLSCMTFVFIRYVLHVLSVLAKRCISHVFSLSLFMSCTPYLFHLHRFVFNHWNNACVFDPWNSIWYVLHVMSLVCRVVGMLYLWCILCVSH
jgi:hypothetical protein